nr:endo-1,4-beta-xylanase [uncultured Draconibacterium sp.]
MKYLNKLWLGAFSLVALVSCTENSLLDYKVDKPGSLIGNEYLNEYDVLKSYVDRSASSDFKLGAGVSVDAFNKQGTVYSHIISNFDEVTAGWAMKHGAVVLDDGRLDTASVKQFVAKAQEAGVSIYGHTLTWHANQNAKYLNSIIADKEIEIDPDNANNALHATTPEAKTDSWDWQLEYTLPTPLTQGVEYTLKMRAKASSAFTVDFWRTNGSSTDYGPNIAFGESWGDVSVTFTPTMDATKLQFCFGAFGGDLYFDDMVLTASGSEDNLIENGTFDDEDLSGWGKPGWHSYTFGVEAVAAGPATWWTNLVINSDVEGDDVSSFFATEVTVGPNPATIGAAGTGADGVGRAIVVKSGDNPTNTWDTQFFVKAPQQLEAGQAYRFSMKVKADKPATIASQSHNNPGGYIYWSMIGNPAVTTEWQEYSNSGVISAAQAGNMV